MLWLLVWGWGICKTWLLRWRRVGLLVGLCTKRRIAAPRVAWQLLGLLGMMPLLLLLQPVSNRWWRRIWIVHLRWLVGVKGARVDKSRCTARAQCTRQWHARLLGATAITVPAVGALCAMAVGAVPIGPGNDRARLADCIRQIAHIAVGFALRIDALHRR